MGILFKKFEPSEYVMVIKKGKVTAQGTGLSVLYNNLTTNIICVPVTAFDGAFAFDDLITSDFQTVCVQGMTTYRITDFEQAIKMADFTYANTRNNTKTAALELFAKRINNILKAIIIKEVSGRDIRTVIKQADELTKLIADKLKENEIIASLGVTIMNVNVLGITTKPETRKALEAAAREQILKEQDDAIYKRRNASIEQERIIKENELNTEIKVAEKEKEKTEKEQEIRLAEMEGRMELREKEAARRAKLEKQEMEQKIEIEERNKEYVALETENEKQKADIQAYAAAAMMKAYENANIKLVEACAMANMDPEALMARGFMELGANAEKIGNINITPDFLNMLMEKFRCE